MSGLTGGGVKAAALARALNISRQRVSQLVAEGKLEGSYSGSGRDRRFDPVIAAKLLDIRLDAGQVMGNGAAAAGTRRELLMSGGNRETVTRRPVASAVHPDAEDDDAARYQRARAEQAEIDTLLKRRRLAEEEGRWVRVSEVERATRTALAGELAQIEAMLRDAARRLADEMGVDYRAAKAVLVAEWRRHRAARRDDLAAQAEAEAEDTASGQAEHPEAESLAGGVQNAGAPIDAA